MFLRLVLNLAGALWIFAGLAALAGSNGAMHEILACLLTSFGLLFFAASACLAHISASSAGERGVSPKN